MKKNNGTTIIEMLVSLIIISIIIALLFNLLIQVRQEDVSNQIQTQFLTNQSTFIKQLQEDIIDYGLTSITNCSLEDANIKTVYKNNKYTCIKLIYNSLPVTDTIKYDSLKSNNIGFLLIYKEYTKFESNDKGMAGSEKWNIQYLRGRYTSINIKDANKGVKTSSWKNYFQTMYTYPDEVVFNESPYFKYSNVNETTSSKSTIASLVIPVENADGEHYDITTEITLTSSTGVACNEQNSKVGLLKCRLCNASNNYNC